MLRRLAAAAGQQGGSDNNNNNNNNDNGSFNRADRGRRGGGGGPLTGLVKGVAAGIGLASESIQHHKEKKRAKQAAEAGEAGSSSQTPEDAAQSRAAPSDSDSSPRPLTKEEEAEQDLVEAVWLLDDAQDELAPPPEYTERAENALPVETLTKKAAAVNLSNEVPASEDVPVEASSSDAATEEDDAAKKKSKDSVAAFIARHPLSASQAQHAPLPMPVILPQRRPGERSRGFIRAYAPLLQDVGIDEATFMDFVTELNKATMPSPWINAINVATLAVQHVPEPVTIAVAIASQIATKVSMEAHSRSKTNDLLDRLNTGFFQPRGLVALVLTWKPSQSDSVMAQFQFNSILQKASDSSSQPQPSKSSKWKNRMKSSHGVTDFEWPESAPLVFPQLDKLAENAENAEAASESAKKKPNQFQRSMMFAAEYMDRRGQAKWATDHPDSGLANLGAKPEFKSRYADPNHPAASGNILALLTGGAIGGDSGGGGLLGLRPQRQGGFDRSQMGRAPQRNERGGVLGSGIGPGTLIKGIKQFMQEVIKNFLSFRVTLSLISFVGRIVPHDCQHAYARAACSW